MNIVETKTSIDANSDEKTEWAQSIMAAAQAGFVGTLLVDPEFFGVFDTCGVDDFIYLWYVLGRELGIDEANNVCHSTETALVAAKKAFAGLEFENITGDPSCATLMDAFCEGFSTKAASRNIILPFVSCPFKLFTKEQLMMWAEERGVSVGIARENDWAARMKPLDWLRTRAMESMMRVYGRLPAFVRRLTGKAYARGFLALIEKRKEWGNARDSTVRCPYAKFKQVVAQYV